jgi:putative transposase
MVMQTVATAKIRINPTPEVVRTIKWHTKCLQVCVDVAWKKGIKNHIKLQTIVYQRIRKHLPSQLAVSCIKQAAGIVKKAKSKPIIKISSPRFNFPRNASLKGDTLVLRLLKTRQEFKFTIPDCYKEYFTWEVSESLLRMDKKGRCFFLFSFSKEVNAIQNNCLQNNVLGIDVGVNNLAVCSDGRFFSSFKVKQTKRKFKHLRSILQSKGTRSAKRLLRKISRRETRYMAWINHNISKKIVSSFTGNKIVMENLKGIRDKNRGKRMNYWISNWSFFQLQKFIQYKAERKGIVVDRVKPHYTSQICHRCGQLGSRLFGSFSCIHCGLSRFSADMNAAQNLAHPMLVVRQAAITQPYSSCDDSKAILFGTAVEHRAKSPILQ